MLIADPGGADPCSGCAVKGNMNAKHEPIYHSPNVRSYAETQINTGRLER